MNDPHGSDTGFSVHILWEDAERTFCRVRSPSGSDSVLTLRTTEEHPSIALLERLAHEFALKEQLNGTWAVHPIRLVREDERMALVFEDPGGEPLERLVGAPLGVERVLCLAVGIAGALEKLHRSGFVHKDFKPAHVLVDCTDSRPRLTGFGIASRLPRERQFPQPPETIAGTLPFMAPEQTGRTNRSIDSRSDLYAFGVTLYQMLTGSLPFTAADPMEWVHCHVARKPVPPIARVDTVPLPVSELVMKLLAKTPEERYQTAAGVERDLRHCLTEWQRQRHIDPFVLGEYDMTDRLLIPEKLYGRQREVDALTTAFDRVVRTGIPELVLVSGYSGIGKSAIVHELHKALVPSRGLFASGKFDQYKRDIPYATLVQAFQGLIRPLLGEPDAELATWRETLIGALGPNARLVTDLIPALRLIIGDPPPVPELEPNQARRRFEVVFQRFIGVFARREHPLALFLDDLQWLDAATLDLLDGLLARSDLQHLMVIGAYRSNEVTPGNPLLHKLQTLRAAGARLDEIVLAPLACEHVEQLIVEALHCEPGRAAPLAHLVHEKTAGNPFFVIQFLRELADSDLLSFAHDTACWSWDLPRIHRKEYTDNVVDLMVVKLVRLPASTQRAVQQLACLGNTASYMMLPKVLGVSEQEIRALLKPALAQELVEQLEDAYGFVHDRVQEAAYSLIPKELRAHTHLRIGRLLAAQTPASKRKEAIFDIVSQLNRGAALVRSRQERQQLAAFNLIAGKRAKASTAYASALTYLTAGAQLLQDDCWGRRHELVFPLQLNLAECEFLTGRLTDAEERLAMLSNRATNTVDQASVACLRMDVYLTLDRSDLAVEVCLDHLRQLGIDWPAHPHESNVRGEYENIRLRLAGRAIEALIDMPLMSDPASLAITDVLSKLLRPAWFFDANLASLAICKVISLSLECGNCDASCFAYVMFPRIAGPRFGDYHAGVQFGQLGFDLVERRGLKRFEAVTYLCYALYVVRWTKHVRFSSEVLRRAFEAAGRTGDLPSGAYTCCHIVSDRLFGGDPLTDVELETEQGLAFSRKARFGLVVDNLTTQLALIRMLRGVTLKFGHFDYDEFNELRTEEHLSGNPALATAACWYWIRKLQGRFFSGDYVAAMNAASIAQEQLWSSSPHLEECEYHFYAALTRAAHFDRVPAEERQEHLHSIAAHCRQLEIWANNCPANFGNRVSLVSAEMARLEGRDLEAMRLYEAAIHLARANDLIHNEALANELASAFYAARGYEKIARVYLQDARRAYRRWGAEGKVRQLDELYPGLRADERAPDSGSTIGAPLEHLDLATVIRVSQAVSGEVFLDRLIETIMRTAIEQAGAERGLLILSHTGEQRLAAEAWTDSDKAYVQLRDAPVSATMIPEPVLYDVLRTGESVILDDAAADPRFATDPHIRQYLTRSVLCLPLMNQAKLIGALYLENNLITRAFRSTRIALLRLLASQAATALENTRLYRDLQEREARIRRLVDANIIGIIVWNAAGDILEANDAFLRMVGYEREDLASGCLRWRDLTPTDWQESSERALAQIRNDGDVQPEEKEYMRKDGSRIPVMVGRAAFDCSGKEGVAFVVDLTERKEAEHRLRESYEMLRELASHRETAREDERKHIAREMHDELGQHLTALRLRASILRMRLGADHPDLVEHTQALVSLVDVTMQVVRGVIASLRPAALDSGIAAALEWLVADFNRNGRTVCHLNLQDENIAVSEDRAIVLFRIVQEALTNVTRHAAARRVIIALERTPDACLLEVHDDGCGFDVFATRKRSFGLAGMEERVLMLGGAIDVISSPGAGTMIKVRLPDKWAIENSR
ncbi:PAS domain S-box-containing protein [Paraburkholderia atlantica]|uniref:AAA family ATPase n=1 Tax=Paraburkholderia atlantica TaxID=2654982 RepID=UPI00128C29F4|nr:AAA family ATPase [Paraburkholderia atlantica]MBB5421474.1 PAS domain S-box-containing protein [Paraburkholderia atlantica]MPW10775.1 AAA family ATPase [Paraburkholderia atlantica]NUY35693.1 AAA family ATPase [Paraburkholderia atlantica]